MPSFVEIKHLRNGEIILSLLDIGKSCPSRLTTQTCLNAFRESKILAKISELTAFKLVCQEFSLKIFYCQIYAATGSGHKFYNSSYDPSPTF